MIVEKYFSKQYIGPMQKTFYIFLLFLLFMGGCTEESRNKIFKQADNLLGKDLRVSYVADSGAIVKAGQCGTEK